MRRKHVQDHLQAARGSLAESDREFAAGDNIRASENLWRAASSAAIAAAESRGWEHCSRRALKTAASRLAAERNDPLIEGRFGVAEKFRMNVDYNFMEDYEIEMDRPHVHEFVRRMAALATESGEFHPASE